MKQVFVTAFAFLAGSLLALGWQNSGGGEVPVAMVVTAEGKNVPAIQSADVMVYQGKARAQVRDWIPLEADQAGLQLAVVIDDGASTSLGVQIAALKSFIQAQPASTEVGVGYMRNGTVRMEQTWTKDLALAAHAVRLPIGMPGVDASPYLSLSDLIKNWPAARERREVLLISSGVDYLYDGPPPENPYLDEAIANAQRAGVMVYSIYFGGEGHAGHNFWRLNWGQSYLSELSEQTGGEAYWQGFGNPVSFEPYLQDLEQKLTHQYRLTFLARPVKKGGLQPVKVRTELHHVDLLSAPQVFVPARP